MSRPGRPSLFATERIERICGAIASGATREGAAKRAGISQRLLRLWLAKGRAGESPYDQLYDAIQIAEGQLETRLCATIAQAARDDWRPALKLLERRFPKRWGWQAARAETTQQPADVEAVTVAVTRAILAALPEELASAVRAHLMESDADAERVDT